MTAEDRLARLEAALRAAPDAVLAVDASLRLTEWNPAAERVLGWSREEALGLRLDALVPPGAQGADVLARLRRGGPLPPYEEELVHRDGSRRRLQVHAAPLGDGGAVATLRDPSERRREQRRHAQLLAAVPVVVARFDHEARVTYAAGGGYETAGVAPSLAHGVRLLDRAPEGSALHAAVAGALVGRSSDVRVLFDDRRWQVHVAPYAPVDEGDEEGGGFLSAVDVTGQGVVHDRLTEVLAVAPLCLVTFDAGGTITYAGGSGYTVLGVDPGATVGQPVLALYGDDPQVRHALRACLQGQQSDVVIEYLGRVWELHYRPSLRQDGSVVGGIVIAQDASGWLGGRLAEPAQEPAHERLPEPLLGFLERDVVTGLLGRRGLQRRLAEPVPAGTERAVAVLDVDAFSLVNDTYGTALADQGLRALAARLLEQVDGVAALGRWHADEFLLVLDAPAARPLLEELVTDLLEAARPPLDLDGTLLHLGLSAGLVTSASAPTGDLAGAARQALRAAKRAGRDRLQWFEPRMADRQAGGGMRLTHELRTALERGEDLVLHYQPVLSLRDSTVRGVEALVRWQHPTEGLLPPARFIEMAERTGLITALGEWVLREACRTAAELRAAAAGPGTVAVNLSAQQLADQRLVDLVGDALAQAQCPPEALVLEVTETAVMADMTAAVATLERLKQLQVGLAVDDFGTGWSSLLYLKHFPVDTLKIDRSFVSGLGTSPDDSAIVASTVSLARTMGITSVAEGVETMDQLALLAGMECDRAQGYLFSRPLPLDGLRSWLGEQPRSAAEVPAEAADDVAQILRMHAEAASLHTIAAALNTTGSRTAHGARWTAQSVARVIARSRYPDLGLPS